MISMKYEDLEKVITERLLWTQEQLRKRIKCSTAEAEFCIDELISDGILLNKKDRYGRFEVNITAL